MDKFEAVELLRSSPGMIGDQDPRVTEALQLARQDAEIAKWFEGHCLLYTTVRAKLREIPVPADLKEKVLSRAKLAQADAERRDKIVPLWKKVVPLAAAAAVALLAGVLWMSMPRGSIDKFADFREREVKLPQRGYAMTMFSTNLSAIHSYILAKQYPDYNLPAALSKMNALGCATLDWRNRKVSMVCLKNAQNKNIYLFVMDATDLSGAPAPGTRDFSQILHLMSASWMDNGKVYILAAPGDETELKRYLD